MKEIERVGLLKMDFLGPEHADADLRRDRGDQADDRRDARHRPRAARRSRRRIRSSRTGRPTASSSSRASGMRDILRKAKPQRLDDLIALNALYRPGPLRSGMVDDFIARKQGKTEVKYELPQLEPILADTYGVIAYQEQVMRISNVRRRLHARRGRPAAQGDGQEERRGDGEDARQVRRRREEERHQREEGGAPLRPDGALRRLRLQQVALDRVRVPRVSDGVPEGELPVALRGGAADDRGAEHRQARDVSRRVPRPRHSRCCRPTSTRASCASRSSRARASASG